MMRRRVVEAPPGAAGGEGPVRVVRSAGPRDPDRAEKDRRSNYGFQRLERLDGNVGYLEMREIASIGMMNGAAGARATGAKDTAAAAMAFLASSDAIIVDLRHCPGGSADTVSFLASYFFGPERRELFTRYDRPMNETRVEYTVEDLPGRRLPDTDLWILVGPGTASAGESFAYLLQQFGRATVVGETTAGAGYNVAFMPVGDGLVAGVSVAKPMHPKTGRGWEGDGVKPDVSTAAADALTTAHVSALRKLIAKASEGPRRKELEWALDRVAPGGNRKVAAAELAALKGRYGERTVTVEEGRLVCRAPNGRARTMDPVGKDSFTWDDQTRASFTRDSAGRPAELVLERADGTVERFPRQTEISGKEAR
jgi:C-terminal processing protease CtpA/Prc